MQWTYKLKVVSQSIDHGQPKVGQVENHVVNTSSLGENRMSTIMSLMS